MKFETRKHALQALVDWFQDNDIGPLDAVMIMIRLLQLMSEFQDFDGAMQIEVVEVDDFAKQGKTSKEHIDEMIKAALDMAGRHK